MVTTTQLTPPGTPPSPAGSVYDMSDDEEGEYNTIRHVKTGRGVKLLFSKSKVYAHPTPSAKDNIPGFIALIQQKPASLERRQSSSSSTAAAPSVSASSLLLAWVPESSLTGDTYDTYVKVDLSDASGPPKQSYLVPPPPTTSSHHSSGGTYAFAVPVSEIYSLLVRPPSIGWWFGSVVINTRGGSNFPALFFHDSECQSTILQRKKIAKESFDPFQDGGGMFWGGDEVLRWLKQYVTVERSAPDPSIFLIEPSEDDLKGLGQPPPKKAEEATAATSSSAGPAARRRDAGMDPVTKALKEARWNFLEKLSQITTFTRRTVDAVVDNPRTPPQVRRLMRNPEVQTLQDEFDSARLYLARWAMGIAEQSERERNQRIWTAKDVLEMEETPLGDFEILDMEAANMSLDERKKPVTLTEWNGWFDIHSGRLQITPDEVKDKIFHRGLSPDDGVRKDAWLFLLGVHDWNSSADEREAKTHSLRDEYIRLKGSWWEKLVDRSGTPEDGEWWKEQKGRIEKDVHRTDRNVALFAGEDTPHPDPNSPFAEVGTNVHMEQMKDMLLTYNEYNRTLGYVQGMSDLLAPIYAVMQDDAIAFWGFVGFMERMERNFLRDQSGMRLQLLTLDHLVQLMDPVLYLHLQKADSTNFFFFFRMLLVWFKREFEWLDVLRLWESLWTDWLSSNFHLFIALAILEKHRNVIMDHLEHFDEVLKYVNDLSQKIDFPSTLLRAEALFRRFQRTVEAVDKKNNFPAPTLRQRPRPSTSTFSSSASAPANSKPLVGAAASINAVAELAGQSANRLHGYGAASSSNTAAASGSATSAATPKGATAVPEGEAEGTPVRDRVISPELRHLLSREIDCLDKQAIKEHGGGVN